MKISTNFVSSQSHSQNKQLFCLEVTKMRRTRQHFATHGLC